MKIKMCSQLSWLKALKKWWDNLILVNYRSKQPWVFRDDFLQTLVQPGRVQGPGPAFQGFGGSSKLVACMSTSAWWAYPDRRQHKSQSCLSLALSLGWQHDKVVSELWTRGCYFPEGLQTCGASICVSFECCRSTSEWRTHSNQSCVHFKIIVNVVQLKYANSLPCLPHCFLLLELVDKPISVKC